MSLMVNRAAARKNKALPRDANGRSAEVRGAEKPLGGPPRWTPSDARMGLTMMLLASLLFALMSTFVYAASRTQPPVAAAVVSFIRVTVNMSLLLITAAITGGLGALFGDRRPSLWLRGFFGAVSLVLSFSSIQRIGPGESAFLSASSGIFVAAMAPWVLAQRNTPGRWMAILGALYGLFLLLQPEAIEPDLIGRLMGLGSGFLAALAYLMIAKAGRTNTPQTIVFYFCLVAMMVHACWFMWRGFELPVGRAAWGWVLAAGLTGSIAQIFLTRAYQLAPAALVSAVGYSAPVLSLLLGVVLFGRIPGEQAILGGALIVMSGVIMPFLSVRRAP